jgi:predicted TIM-barrel fold metal-dependent hydrolase
MTDAAVIVSCDSHAGPRLRQDLRAYCPTEHLDEYDAFVAAYEAAQAVPPADPALAAIARDFAAHPNAARAGHHDMAARIEDMNHDGVAAEVIYHASQNGEPLPFISDPNGGLGPVPAGGFALGAVGYRIYNQWLADFVSLEPERHVGLMYLPMWDIDAATRELEWAAAAGLRGVNFPPPSRAGHLEYNHPAWDPFWSACEHHGVALHTHSSGAAPFDYFAGPGGRDLLAYECGGWMARRAIWWLIYGLVFDRHPQLRLVITEQYEGWWTATLAELDAVHARFGRSDLAKEPSESAREHVLLGCSFLSSHFAEQASRDGFVANVLWGRDYPHIEGTFQPRDDAGAEPISQLSLRCAVSALPPDEREMIAGANAVRELGLDGAALARVAARIGAPSIAQLGEHPAELPPIYARSNAFRGQAGPGW